jgi:hypothetical protein
MKGCLMRREDRPRPKRRGQTSKQQELMLDIERMLPAPTFLLIFNIPVIA